jgi:hypothetical protein
MNPTAPIRAGTAGIGEISVNPDDIRGEGGDTEPVLVVPITVRLNARPSEAAIALQSSTPVGQPIGPPVHLDLRPGMPVSSMPWGTPAHLLDLPFRLTPAIVERLDRLRHRNNGALELRIGFSVVAAWVRRVYNQMTPNQPADTEVPFELMYGMLADTTAFWTTQVQDLVFTVNQSTWVDKVLPGVGHDEVRLVEVRLPRELDEREGAAFGRQLRHLDRLDYQESVAASRALLHAWEQRLGATRQNPVGQVVGDQQQWPVGDPRRTFLDELWVTAKTLANAAHHEAAQPTPLSLAEPETRAHLLLIALLSEWLSAVTEVK